MSTSVEAVMRTMPVNQIRMALADSSSAFLELPIGEDHSYLWVVTDAEIRAVELPARRALEDLIDTYLRELESAPNEHSGVLDNSASQWQKTGALLSKTLFGAAWPLLNRPENWTISPA